MRSTIFTSFALTTWLAGGAAMAQTKDAPSSPPGAPAAAAQGGSSMAGKEGAKNEMKAHDENEKAQKTMDNPRRLD